MSGHHSNRRDTHAQAYAEGYADAERWYRRCTCWLCRIPDHWLLALLCACVGALFLFGFAAIHLTR